MGSTIVVSPSSNRRRYFPRVRLKLELVAFFPIIIQVEGARNEFFFFLFYKQSIAGLQGTLQDLQRFLQSNDEKVLSIFSRLVNNIADCLADLRVLEARLDSEKRKKLMRKMRLRVLN